MKHDWSQARREAAWHMSHTRISPTRGISIQPWMIIVAVVLVGVMVYG